MAPRNLFDRLSFRLAAAGALMLLALLPLAWPGKQRPVRPVSAYGKMHAPVAPSPQAPSH